MKAADIKYPERIFGRYERAMANYEMDMDQYIKEFKAWTTKVEEMLKDAEVEESELDKWTEQMEGFMENLEKKRNERTDITAEEVESEVSNLHKSAERLLNTAPKGQQGKRVPIGEHKLPPLPYDYNALEPYISEKIMKLHHDKHHKSYVDGLNKAEKKMEKARQTGDFDLLKHWEREAAFHGSGHYLHTIFWNIMSPNGGGKPTGALLAQIKQDFGSYDAFKNHFTEAAKQAEGVGWAILVWAPRAHRLEILQTEKHQFFTQWDTIPLLVLDVWEHAYYLQYMNNRGDYISNWWNVVNWDHVEKRFNEAKQLQWEPF